MNSREILEFITDNEKVTLSKLSQLMGIKRAQPLYDIRDGKIKAISANYADKILSVFPEYSRAWLITGEGQPFSKNKNEVNLSDLTERFLQVIDKLEVTDYKVWNTLENLSKATMSKIRRGICGVSMNTLQEFCQTYNVNANYILTGKGDMFLDTGKAPANSLTASQNQRMFEDMIKDKDNQIADLKAEIERMKSAMDKLTGQNEIMREQLGLSGRRASTKSA